MDNEIENTIENGIRIGFELGAFMDHIHKEYDMSYVEIAKLIESTLYTLRQIDPENLMLNIDESPDKVTNS